MRFINHIVVNKKLSQNLKMQNMTLPLQEKLLSLFQSEEILLKEEENLGFGLDEKR